MGPGRAGIHPTYPTQPTYATHPTYPTYQTLPTYQTHPTYATYPTYWILSSSTSNTSSPYGACFPP